MVEEQMGTQKEQAEAAISTAREDRQLRKKNIYDNKETFKLTWMQLNENSNKMKKL